MSGVLPGFAGFCFLLFAAMVSGFLGCFWGAGRSWGASWAGRLAGAWGAVWGFGGLGGSGAASFAAFFPVQGLVWCPESHAFV